MGGAKGHVKKEKALKGVGREITGALEVTGGWVRREARFTKTHIVEYVIIISSVLNPHLE